MKLTSVFATLAGAASVAHAANSFAAANNYYVYSLPEEERIELLDAMKDAGMLVLRTWISGHEAGQKGSSNEAVADLEDGGLGTYDNTKILEEIDQLMVEAHDRGIKLLISFHDKNALQAGDIYGSKYGDYDFYTSGEAIDFFTKRIQYVMTEHKNALLGDKTWAELGTHIFGLESQNEPMIFDQDFYKNNLDWICSTAQTIRDAVPNEDILIFTGGGSGSASVQDQFFSEDCPVDAVAIHDYNGDFTDFLDGAISKAQDANKKLIVEEWGSLYDSDDRAGNLKYNVDQMNSYKVPWVYWQLITNDDPHQGEDYEIAVNGEDWDLIKGYALDTAKLEDAPFDFSASLKL